MFELILLSSIGVLLLVIGLLLWKRQKIEMVHDYHHTKVTQQNKKAYTEKVGKGCVLISIGCFVAGVVDFITNSPYGFIAFALFTIWGLVLIFKAQKKYNSGLF